MTGGRDDDLLDPVGRGKQGQPLESRPLLLGLVVNEAHQVHPVFGVPQDLRRHLLADVAGPDEWAYNETSTIDHERHGDVLEHTDRNRLRRVKS